MKTFLEQLELSGSARGRNQADYKVLTPNEMDKPIIERVYKGKREEITGFNSTVFCSLDLARFWASEDQKHQMLPFTSLSDRPLIHV